MKIKKYQGALFTKVLDNYFINVFKTFYFVYEFFRVVFKPPYHIKEWLNQCYEIGLKAMPLISITSLIVGLVFTKQSRGPLENFGATSWLPSLVGIAIIKTLGPLLTALVSAGKVSSGISAELASMKVTEQIDAMEVSAINPFKYLVVTRVLAVTFIIPILVFYCSFISMMGAYLNVAFYDKTSFIAFFQSAFSMLTFKDIVQAVTKSAVFGFTIGIIGTSKGYDAKLGTSGVGLAANKAVVLSMLLIFIEEITIVQLFNL
jgi:phospholipid/cholesterol/gamma-HCH transport system permease protein